MIVLSSYASALSLLRVPTLSRTFYSFTNHYSHEIFALGLRTCFLPMFEINWPTRPPPGQRGDETETPHCWTPKKWFRKLYSFVRKEYDDPAILSMNSVFEDDGCRGQPRYISGLFNSDLELLNCPNCCLDCAHCIKLEQETVILRGGANWLDRYECKKRREEQQQGIVATLVTSDFEIVEDPREEFARANYHPEIGQHKIEIKCSGRCSFSFSISINICNVCPNKKCQSAKDVEVRVSKCPARNCRNIVCSNCRDELYSCYGDFSCQLCYRDVDCKWGLCDACFERDNFYFCNYVCEGLDLQKNLCLKVVCCDCVCNCKSCGYCMCVSHGVDEEEGRYSMELCFKCAPRDEMRQERGKRAMRSGAK